MAPIITIPIIPTSICMNIDIREYSQNGVLFGARNGRTVHKGDSGTKRMNSKITICGIFPEERINIEIRAAKKPSTLNAFLIKICFMLQVYHKVLGFCEIFMLKNVQKYANLCVVWCRSHAKNYIINS